MSDVRLTALGQTPSDGLREAEAAGFLTDYAAHEVRIDTRAYHAIVSRDNIGTRQESDWRWHVSVSGQYDVPRWRDLVAIGHRLRPGVVMVVGVPPRSWWVNVHPHCLHLYETKDENLVRQWQSEGQGTEPS